MFLKRLKSLLNRIKWGTHTIVCAMVQVGFTLNRGLCAGLDSFGNAGEENCAPQEKLVQGSRGIGFRSLANVVFALVPI